MNRIEVGGDAPYTVHVGSGALQQVHVPERRAALLYDTGLPEQLVREVHERLKPELSVALPAGESCKRIDVYAGVLSRLAERALPRDAAVVGAGGGAATDLAGFVASTYLRGVAFYTLPTTLLAQVDAAVGGKTGVNLPEGKNLVGTFWPPRAVWCDTDVLATLPDRRFREGAAEVFKHGLLTDGALCEAVLRPDFTPTFMGLPDIVADAVRVKADIVTRDLTEQGERAHLNLGHTLAHPLEAVTDHDLPHGEAVAYGLHFAALLSRELGAEDMTALTGRFLSWMRPAGLPPLEWKDLEPYVLRDKKADSEGVRFVLLRALGEPYLTRVPAATLQAVFDGWQRDVKGILAGNS